mmetsp:Transcript_3707/g.11739  ORF Transcript_3707/g.11739 Transcript_3707/m.11739 type:complete len:208 (+) Transcript_3707:125-748(+)
MAERSVARSRSSVSNSARTADSWLRAEARSDSSCFVRWRSCRYPRTTVAFSLLSASPTPSSISCRADCRASATRRGSRSVSRFARAESSVLVVSCCCFAIRSSWHCSAWRCSRRAVTDCAIASLAAFFARAAISCACRHTSYAPLRASALRFMTAPASRNVALACVGHSVGSISLESWTPPACRYSFARCLRQLTAVRQSESRLIMS